MKLEDKKSRDSAWQLPSKKKSLLVFTREILKNQRAKKLMPLLSCNILLLEPTRSLGRFQCHFTREWQIRLNTRGNRELRKTQSKVFSFQDCRLVWKNMKGKGDFRVSKLTTQEMLTHQIDIVLSNHPEQSQFLISRDFRNNSNHLWIKRERTRRSLLLNLLLSIKVKELLK